MRRTLLSLAFLVALSSVAHADPLVLVVNDPVRNIGYGETATFFGTLTNQTSETIIIGTPGFTLPGQRVPYSYEIRRLPPFIGGGSVMYGPGGIDNPAIPTELASQTSTGIIRLFSIGVTPGGTFDGVFTIHYYLLSEPGVLRTASANFTVVVGPTPEPATLVLLATGLAGVFGAARRRRRGEKG